ncbi:MAG: glucosylglycerol hydrolase [Chloroflexota bacterium]
MITTSGNFELHRELTQDVIREIQDLRTETDTDFDATQQIVRYLGAHLREDGKAQLGFWTPVLKELDIPPERVFLDIFTPQETIDFMADEQQVAFRRDRINLLLDGEYAWGVVSSFRAGNRDTVGTLYQVVYQSRDEEWIALRDHLAYSLPFGAFAPAEFYDMNAMFDARSDKAHYHNALDTAPDPDGVPRVQEPMNILQVHTRYATEAGTIAGLTRTYQRIADKLTNNETLTPAEQNFVNYDAIQLMPIEPTIEYENGNDFWQSESGPFAEDVTIRLRKPDMTNWGYDVVISGSSAINPALLESRRPDELLDLIEVCHHFPGKPIKVMLDIVYGHIDNQALPLLPKEYFAGANMYGQNVNFLHPVVRASLLEMMRRKHNYGVDGIRVDGAQDFKWWNSETNEMVHDDDFLRLMNDLELEVDGVVYRPWMIFEDGRPWPRDDWELASTYREVTKQMPNVWQWGPLTFAHNTPFLFTFWLSKWWRIREMADIGREWITGCANHDTLRRGAQVPTDSRINTYLGDTLPDIIRKAYDNPAAKLFDYAMMPGIPMEFLNGLFRAPWGFIRNTDDKYGVKVVSEEARWLYWRMDKRTYAEDHVFTRLKAHGFTELDSLRRFMNTLDHAVQATGYYMDAVVRLLNSMYPPLIDSELTIDSLKQIARDFMDDKHDFCNVASFADDLNPDHVAFNTAVRQFRMERRWLIENLGEGEFLDHLHPSDGATIFCGYRVSPDGNEHLLFVANMEGEPTEIIPTQFLPASAIADGWELALATPELAVENIAHAVTLADSQGVVFVKQM